MPYNFKVKQKKLAYYLFPLVLLLCTRLGIELVIKWIPAEVAWITGFTIYYLLILLITDFARRKGVYDETSSNVVTSFGKVTVINLVWGVILPALLPIYFFFNNISRVPGDVLMLIMVVALVNPFFEEKFWRRLMSNMPASKTIKILYSAFWFSAGHYILWASYWFTEPKIWVSTVVATFIMGICWMIFFLRTGRYRYILLSHMLVDIFNLSAAVYMGIELKTI